MEIRDLSAAINDLLKTGGTHYGEIPADLRGGAGEREALTEGPMQADSAFAPDRRGFDGVAIARDDKERESGRIAGSRSYRAAHQAQISPPLARSKRALNPDRDSQEFLRAPPRVNGCPDGLGPQFWPERPPDCPKSRDATEPGLSDRCFPVRLCDACLLQKSVGQLKKRQPIQ
jgi:hypothetical protein